MTAGEDTRDADVVVVGAGPGGATLSYLLARSGVDVCLVERERDLERSFRGYLFQPFVLRTFDEMGVLEDVLALDHHELREPTLNFYGREISPFDLEAYEEPYDHALLMEQASLLSLLIERADEYEGFTYRDGTTVTDLLVDDTDHDEGGGGRTDSGEAGGDQPGSVRGVRARDRGTAEEITLRARVVVGADGRYSVVRKMAGIDPGLYNPVLEIAWFKLPADAVTGSTLARVNDDGILAHVGLGEEEAQLGYVLERDGFEAFREAGIESFQDRVAGVDPSLEAVVREHVTGFDDCRLLRVEPGLTERWIDDGLLLLGDAAHVASPIGGQGNGLAIADAVVAHAVLCEALADTTGSLPRAALERYVETRRPTVRKILRLQRRGERIISTFVRHRGRIPLLVRRRLLTSFTKLAFRSPVSDHVREQFAWGSWESVDTSPFVD